MKYVWIKLTEDQLDTIRVVLSEAIDLNPEPAFKAHNAYLRRIHTALAKAKS